MKISKATIPFDPFPAQQRIMDAFENHRFVVVNHGNRFGGTRVMLACGIKYFVDVLNEHRRVEDYCPARWVLLAPTDGLGKQMWREIKYLFPKDWALHCSNADRRILTVNGGIPIEFAEHTLGTFLLPPPSNRGTRVLARESIFSGWKTNFKIRFTDNVYSLDEIVSIINLSGFGIGIGSGRSAGYGRYKIVDVK